MKGLLGDGGTVLLGEAGGKLDLGKAPKRKFKTVTLHYKPDRGGANISGPDKYDLNKKAAKSAGAKYVGGKIGNGEEHYYRVPETAVGTFVGDAKKLSKAFSHHVVEDVEYQIIPEEQIENQSQLDELSRNTLSSYIVKASKDVDKRQKVFDKDFMADRPPNKNKKKLYQRLAGREKAFKRLKGKMDKPAFIRGKSTEYNPYRRYKLDKE